MTRFITIDEAASGRKAVLWEEVDGKCRALSLHDAPEQAPEADECEIYKFEVPTTLTTFCQTNSQNYPVLDADGAPLWSGAHIQFRIPNYHVVAHDGAGEFRSYDTYTAVHFISDVPIAWRNRSTGQYIEDRREFWDGHAEYQNSGPHQGYLMLKGKLGDPHEHGQTDLYIRLDDDPRTVCTLTPRLPTP